MKREAFDAITSTMMFWTFSVNWKPPMAKQQKFLPNFLAS
jgi:hypothetical protein